VGLHGPPAWPTRTLKRDYWERPHPYSIESAYCTVEDQQLRVSLLDHALKFTYAVDLQPTYANGNLLPDSRTRETTTVALHLAHLLSSSPIQPYDPASQPYRLPIPTNLVNHIDDSLTMSPPTHTALLAHTLAHAWREKSERHASGRSIGSVRSDTSEDEDGSQDPPDPDCTVSDGCLYAQLGCAAWATSKQIGRDTTITRGHHPLHPTWTGLRTVLKSDPTPITAFTVEVEGLQVAIEWAMERPEGRLMHLTDCMAVISSAGNLPDANARSRMRSSEHYVLDYIRTSLVELGFHEPFDPLDEDLQRPTLKWVRGHAGIKIQETVDRHAGRAAMRHTVTPLHYPAHIAEHAFTLHFYECVVKGDVRKHVTNVLKAIHTANWLAWPSQGKLARTLVPKHKPSPPLHPIGTPPSQVRERTAQLNGIANTPHRRAYTTPTISKTPKTPHTPLPTPTDPPSESTDHLIPPVHVIHECPEHSTPQAPGGDAPSTVPNTETRKTENS
jgi:ribonuclease HI